MNPDVAWLREKAAACGALLESTKWYVFGSVLKVYPSCSDIDVLIIYKTTGDVARIRASVVKLELERPIHLLFMTEQEEREVNFISSESCIEIFPGSSRP